MRTPFRKREHTYTSFVSIDTHQCKACWKCISACKKQVIGKINLPFHKHALIINPAECTGCFACLAICDNTAFRKI